MSKESIERMAQNMIKAIRSDETKSPDWKSQAIVGVLQMKEREIAKLK